ncbi:MAG: hypothetical protein JXQ82_07280 [Methanomicrobiaceae archaeon]|nr:hypothetical protein [Methanomicrobiaceae archaeon]
MVLVGEFIIGMIITQIMLFVLLAVLGAIDSALLTQHISEGWKFQLDGIKNTSIILFSVIDICGGLGFVGLFNTVITGK